MSAYDDVAASMVAEINKHLAVATDCALETGQDQRLDFDIFGEWWTFVVVPSHDRLSATCYRMRKPPSPASILPVGDHL